MCKKGVPNEHINAPESVNCLFTVFFFNKTSQGRPVCIKYKVSRMMFKVKSIKVQRIQFKL